MNSFEIFDTFSPLVIRVNGGSFFLKECPDEIFNKPQLIALLRRISIADTEIAVALYMLSSRPEHNEISFDFQTGEFLETAKYYPQAE